MLHLHLAALALAGASLAVSGCGSSKATSATSAASTATTTNTTAPATVPSASPTATVTLASGKPLTHAAWLARGNAICAQANVKRGSTAIKRRQDYARVLPQVALYDKTEATELAKLVPPTAKVADWKQIVEGFQLYGEYTARVGEYTAVNNLKSAQPVIAIAEQVHKKLIATAARDGLKQCAKV